VKLGRILRGSAAVAAMAVVAASLRVARNARKAARNRRPAGDFLEVDGVRLHYIDRGAGSPVVLLHGNGSMIEDFEASGIVESLSRRFRVIAFDRPGFGLTNRPRSRVWTASAQAELIHRALARLGVEPGVVLGHSWGALAAAALAIAHPEDVRWLVLVAGYYFPRPRTEFLMFALPAAPVIGELLSWFILPLLARLMMPAAIRRIFAPEPVPQHFAAKFPSELLLRPSQLRASAIDTELMLVSAARLARRYREIAAPAVILTGEDDHIVDFERQSQRLAGTLCNARLMAFDGVGHMVHHSRPAAIVAAVESLAGPHRTY
jgi:pimeloyl-ACP methyl ester carboxylesterase